MLHTTNEDRLDSSCPFTGKVVRAGDGQSRRLAATSRHK
jgi:hypothetical protein